MNYTQEIQRVLKYIALNLYEELSLTELGDVANLSKFHFHKLFKQEVGINLHQYIRARRLANSSSLLLHTEMGIIEISLLSGFSSQAAFSRAFKELYGFPPHQYRQTFKNTLKRGMTMTEEEIKGWLITGNNVSKFNVSLDDVTFHQGKQSVKISSVSELVASEDFATVMQQFQAVNYLGKRVKVSAFIKCENITGSAALWMRMDGNGGELLLLDNMQNRPITGEVAWNYYFSVLDVPFETSVINIGFLQQGEGTTWVDSFAFEVVDKTVPTTEVQFGEIFPTEPTNLSFDD